MVRYVELHAGHARSLAVLDNGSAWAWGNVGRIGLPVEADNPLAAICGSGPQEVGHHRFAQPVAQRLNTGDTGVALSCLIDAAHELMAIGPGGGVTRIEPLASITDGAPIHLVEGLQGRFTQVCANESASYALDEHGRVWSWGHHHQGQLGRMCDGSLDQPPGVVQGLPAIAELAAGQNHVLARTRSGQVWAWGANAAGQLGQGHLESSSRPVRVSSLNVRVRAIAAGETHSLAIDDRGRLHAWGSNHCGQLGPLKATDAPAWTGRPLRVELPFSVAQVGAGRHYTVALVGGGEIYTWGWNGLGQLGTESAATGPGPHRIKALKGVERISVGPTHVLALNDRGLHAWGDNRHSACGLLPRQATVSQPHLIRT